MINLRQTVKYAGILLMLFGMTLKTAFACVDTTPQTPYWIEVRDGETFITFHASAKTFGAVPGQFCACAFRVLNSVKSVDDIRFIDEETGAIITNWDFTPNDKTTASFNSALPGTAWQGFSSAVSGVIPPERTVAMEIKVTLHRPSSSHALVQLSREIEQAGSIIATDEANDDGSLAKQHLSTAKSPQGSFIKPPVEIMTEGTIGENSLGIELGRLSQSTFMIDPTLSSINPGIFIDPWRWHWIVGNPWDWLWGFRLELIEDGDFPGPRPVESDLLRVVAEYDDDRDMVMGLEKGTRFVQDFHFTDGSLKKAIKENRLPTANEMTAFLGGSMSIIDETGKQRLNASIDRLFPEPNIVPMTLRGSIGENQLGIQAGTEHSASLQLNLDRLSIDPGLFPDPVCRWHWLIGRKPWDWLRGITIEIEPNIPRPGPNPGPWDRMRIIAPFDEPGVDMVMDPLTQGAQFVQDLYFPEGSLNKETLPSEDILRKFAGGEFQILNSDGKQLLEGKFDKLVLEATDSDDDGVDDFTDNCATEANEDQRDTDNDGFGNSCDPDFNNNGIVDQFDFSRLKTVFGSDDAPDEDLNGNGVVDQFDFSKLKAFFGEKPGPSAIGMHQ